MEEKNANPNLNSKVVTQNKIVLIERYICKNTGKGFKPVEAIEYDVFYDDELMFTQRFTNTTNQSTCTHPAIKAMLELTSVSPTYVGKTSCNCCSNSCKSFNPIRKIIRKLFHLKR